ncbi:hypothetical protein [Lysobacter antibioticus]|uniref:hypothetical protein n=1 Tax=Lysobacter antibioticus TaxID=84531 RepID=UPI001269B87D|nr:hypothetical protein [Lysobacter antibioticus]
MLPVLPASMPRPQVRTDCRIDRSVFACVVGGVAELIAIGVFGLCERPDLAAARTELLTRWLLMLLRAKSHSNEIEAEFCETYQASVKKIGRGFRLTA